MYNDESITNKFISFTSQTYFESKFFNILTAELVYKRATFKGVVSTYNSVFENNFNDTRGDLEIKRLIEFFIIII